MSKPNRTPIPRSDEQWEEMAAINTTDIENARALWLALAPDPMKELLDAKENTAETQVNDARV
jgi:hypothetical protein